MNWIKRLFARTTRDRSPAIARLDCPPVQEHWAKGDLAECIHDGGWFNLRGQPCHGPSKGQRNVVISALDPPPMLPSGAVQLLQFSAFRGGSFVSDNFRKIIPQSDALEAADTDFLDDLQPAKTIVPVRYRLSEDPLVRAIAAIEAEVEAGAAS